MTNGSLMKVASIAEFPPWQNAPLGAVEHGGKLSNTVKPVLNGHSKTDKTKVLMTNGSLMQVESIAECSPWQNAPLGRRTWR